jgi:hypothetical protein
VAETPDMRAKFEEAGMSVTALNCHEFARSMKDDFAR